MTAGGNCDARRVRELRLPVIEGFGALGECTEHIEPRQACRTSLQCRQLLDQTCEHFVVELVLPGKRPIPRAQHLVLEGFELLGDVAFRALECLSASVLCRDLVRVAAPELYVVAVHAVVSDFERRDAGALAFPRLQLAQKGISVAGQAPQFVELPIVARGNDAAVAQPQGRALDDGLPQPGAGLGILADGNQQLREQRAVHGGQGRVQIRELRERGAELGQIPRPRGAQPYPREDALEIANVAHLLVKAAGSAGGHEGTDALMAMPQLPVIPQRTAQPSAQAAAAHGGGGAIQHVGESAAPFTGEARRQLQIAPRHGIQNDGVFATLEAQPLYMGERPALGVFDVLQQTAGRCHGAVGRFATEAGQVPGAELRREQLHCRGSLEVPAWQFLYARMLAQLGDVLGILADQHLGRRDALELGGQGRASRDL